MALKTVKRSTFSLTKATLLKLEMSIPKSKRSKFVDESIIKNLSTQATKGVTLKEVTIYWKSLANRTKRKTNKSGVELVRADRLSH